MDPKRERCKAQASSSSSSSSSDSSCGSPASPSGSPAPGTGSLAAGPAGNAFANDGSFMEMFKKKMEAEAKRKKDTQQTGGEARATEQGQTPVEKKPPPVTSFVGKRRGGVFLKTGMVAKKQKDETESKPGKSDAWSKYMAEVKKYKAHECGDDDKTRPLVK